MGQGDDQFFHLLHQHAVAKLRDHISGRELELLQQRSVSRVVVQALEYGVRLRSDQAAVTLGISSV
jgi:hypothetical protein